MQKHRPISINLTDAQIEAIADRAVEKLDARIGRSVRTRALWMLGSAMLALISLVASALFLK